MKKYLTDEILRDFFKLVDSETLNNDDVYKVRQLIMAKVFEDITNGEFNRYGEVLKIDINRDVILELYNSESLVNKTTDNILAILNMPIMVTRYEDIIIITDLHEISVVYKHLLDYGDLNGFQITYGTALYMKDNIVKVINYKKDSKFENIISNLNYIFENEIIYSLEKHLINHIKHNLYVFFEKDEVKSLIDGYSGPTYGFKDNLKHLDAVMSDVVYEMDKLNIDFREYIMMKTREFENNISSEVTKLLSNHIVEQKLDINDIINGISAKNNGTIDWVNKCAIEIIKRISIRDIVQFKREQDFMISHKNKIDLFIKAFEFNKEIDKIIDKIDKSVDKKAKSVMYSGTSIFGPDKVERRFRAYDIPITKNDFKFYLNGINAGRETILDFRDMKEFTLSYRGKEVFHFTEDMAKRINTKLDEILNMKIE